jgi:hypothetical protein
MLLDEHEFHQQLSQKRYFFRVELGWMLTDQLILDLCDGTISGKCPIRHLLDRNRL